MSFRVVTLSERQMANTQVFYFFLIVILFLFFVNSQARLKVRRDRGRIRVKTIMAQTRCTLHHGVPGKETGIL